LITDKGENGPTPMPQAQRRLSRFARMREGPAGKAPQEKKEPCLGLARLRMSEIYS